MNALEDDDDFLYGGPSQAAPAASGKSLFPARILHLLKE